MKPPQELREMFKIPEDVCDFLNDHFRKLGVYPVIPGFVQFFQKNSGLFKAIQMVVDEKKGGTE